MTEAIAITALHSVASLAGIAMLFGWLVRDYRLDALRQRLFDVRGDLFDYAAQGGVSFEHPAYGMLRTRMNRLIRFAHRFTSMELVLLLVLPSSILSRENAPRTEWLAALDTVEDPAVREQLQVFELAMLSEVVHHMAFSPLIFMLSPILVPVAFARGVITFSRSRRKIEGATQVADRMESQSYALDEGAGLAAAC